MSKKATDSKLNDRKEKPTVEIQWKAKRKMIELRKAALQKIIKYFSPAANDNTRH